MKNFKKSLLKALLCIVFVFGVTMLVQTSAQAATKPSGLKQTYDSSSSVEVEWTAQLDNGIKYEVSISTDKSNWIVKENGTTSNSKYISGLNAGTTYYVRVRAFVGSSPTGYSESLECVTTPNSSTSSISKIGSTTNSLNMNWTAVPGANAYLVTYYNNYSNQKTLTVTTNSVNIQGLDKNSKYKVNVTSLRKSNSTGYIADGSTKNGSSYGVTPGKLTGMEVDNFWFYIKQISTKYNSIASADGYTVEVWTAYKSKDTKIKSTTTTSSYGPDFSNKAFGKHNMFKVRGRAYTTNADGKKVYGAWSSWEYTCPQPDVIKISKTSKGLKIKYDTIKGAKKYAVYVSTKQKSGYKKVATTKKTTYTITKFNKKSLKKAKTYYVYVVPYNKAGKPVEAGNSYSCWSKKY